MESHACTRKIHAGGSACTSPSVRPDHLFLRVVFVCNALFLFCCIFICTNLNQTLLMSARSSFHRGNSTFLVTPSMCCVFICTNSTHTLKTSLCCAFYWRKPFHDPTLDLLYFHMYTPQSNLNSRQRRKSTVAALKKRNYLNFPLKKPVAPAGMVRPHRFEV